MRALVKMTKLVLPKMKEARRGVVVNVSSFEGAITAPFYAVYGASKAFVDSFSKSMAVELQGTGVKCATHPALLVATKLSIPNEKRRKGSLFTPWPEQWAAGSVNAVGYEEHAHPYWAHSLQAGVFLALPAALKNKIRCKHRIPAPRSPPPPRDPTPLPATACAEGGVALPARRAGTT
jgi:17beta-estradiol 17-dehydrogenase / very-long-chain 3-oxoacyl-CoA reductase